MTAQRVASRVSGAERWVRAQLRAGAPRARLTKQKPWVVFSTRFLDQFYELLFVTPLLVMFGLRSDVLEYAGALRFGHAERAVTFLPGEQGNILLHPP